MKLTFIVLGMLLAYMSTRAIAASCPSADQLSPSNKSVRELIGKADNFNSVEDFVSALPNEMRSNFVMMAESRSFQAGSRENPRVIMASSDGSVRVTFGTDPGARGYNNIEISIWNPDKGEFEYKEVAYKEENGKMHGDENPRACQTCHGKPPKPNWDTYNYWSGAVPFNKDKLIGGSEEANWYLGYLDRIEKKSPENARFNALKPLLTAAKVRETFKKDNVIQVPFQDSDGNITDQRDGQGGISVQMFDRANSLMRCTHAKRIQKMPIYENAKYLLAGISSGCEMKGFMAPWMEKNAENYFRARIPGLRVMGKTDAEKFDSLQKSVRDDTYKRQMAHRRRKEGRQKAFWLKELTNDYGKDQAKVKLEEEWKKNIAAVGLNVVGTVPGDFREDIGENPDGVGNLRMMLEPLGVPVSSFSTSVDPSDYAFADIFSPDYMLDSEREKIQAENTTGKDFCAFLQERNNEKIQGSQAEIVARTNQLCSKSLEVTQEGEKLQKDVSAALQLKNREKVKGILEVKCMQCHQDIGGGQSASGAPVFPFNDLSKMDALFNSPEGKYREYRQVMKERINRPAGYLGAMPVKYISELQSDEISALNMWLDSVKVTP